MDPAVCVYHARLWVAAHAGSAHVVIAAYRLGEVIFRGTI